MSQVVWSDARLEPIVRLVCTRAGLFFRDSQREIVESGIRQAMRRTNHTDFAEYGRHVALSSRAFDDLMIELTVGETYFFRDTGQIEFIRREILPELRTRRGLSHLIRVWSAGCATGEEPYSLAMLFREEGLAERTHILATDISRRSLERAEAARYGEWSLRGDGASLARKYLQHDGEQYQLAPAIRSSVQFEYLNLGLDMYPSTVTGTRELDLILCRNVLIYFDRETIASVARRFHDALAPGGWVMTAAGDPSLAEHAPFEVVHTAEGLFYRCGLTVKPTFNGAKPLPGVSAILSETWPHVPKLLETEPLDPVAEPKPVAAVVPKPVVESLETAQLALDKGHYRFAAEIAARLPDSPEAAAIQVQALANSDLKRAEQVCAEATRRHILSVHLQYLHAMLLLDLNREHDAVQAMRRTLYLDNSLAIAHFTLGSLLRRVGDLEGARRSFRNAKVLCDVLPANEIVRFSEGERAGMLAAAAQTQLEGLKR